MALNVSAMTPLRILGSRSMGAQAAVSKRVAEQRMPKEAPESTVLENGLTIHSQENHSPVSRIVIVSKAGSRYEDGSNLGLTHILRNAAGLATKNSTSFAITKNIEWVGANVTASTTRDHVIFTLECNRDYASTAAQFLNEMVFDPAFKFWELEDALPRVKRDLQAFKKNQGAQLIEALHAASFRGGLANPLFIHPDHHDKIKPEQLMEFCRSHITGPRTVVSAMGVDHERLAHLYKKIENIKSTSVDESKPSKFNSHGGEVRVEFRAPSTMAALAMESCGLSNAKDAMTMEVLKQILGISKARVPFSELQATRLGQAVLALKPSNPFSIGAFTSTYSDTGLFGIAMAAGHEDIRSVAKAAVSVVRDIAKGSIKDAELQSAKSKAKYAMAKRMSKDTKVALLSATQLLARGSPHNYEETEKLLDSVSLQDISAVAQKMSKVKPSMAVVGKLYNSPHLEDILQ